MKWNLTLRPAHEPQRSAAAWFVPGEEAQAWLGALAQLPLDPQSARVAVVPRSAADRRPLGALVYGSARQSKTAPGVSPRLRPYGRAANNLFLPIEAAIDPPIAERDLAALLADDRVYVWHPAAGLIAYGEEELLRPTDLLSAPAETAADWTRAAPGVAYNQRLLSLSTTFSPQPDDVMAEARDDIGSSATQLELLPAGPDEPQSLVLAGAQRHAWLAIARIIYGATTLLQRLVALARRGADAIGLARYSLGRISLILLVLFAVGCVVEWLRHQGPGEPRLSEPRVNEQPWSPSPGVPAERPRLPTKLSPHSVHDPLDWPLLLGLAVVATFVLFHIIGEWRAMLSHLIPRPGRPRPTQPAPARPAGAARPGWLARVRAWAGARMQTVSESLANKRERELDRLLGLLNRDPDDGLRFALPLAGDARRGNAPPGAALASRTVDYRAGVGYGSGAADVWNVREEYRRRLTLRYRELANREISLQRHRRAAYILAELLGDWNSAANTLRDGGHYREAAAIYDERLHRPLEAAQCLERGGAVAEAIVIYERLGRHETIGDLYMRLEQPDDAERAYRAAVEQKRAAEDRLGAARLLEEKIGAPEEAWDEIVEGWPDSRQAEQCLHEAFRWTERHNDAERAKSHLRRLAQMECASWKATQVVAKMSGLATRYPEPTVQAEAAALTLQLASPRLPFAAPVELGILTAAVSRLAPEDRLLASDCHRYAGERPAPPLAASKPAMRPGFTRVMHLRSTVELPFGNVRACVAAGETIYAAGWRDGESGMNLALARGTWQGDFHEPDNWSWAFPGVSEERPVLLAIDTIQESKLCARPIGAMPTSDYPRIFSPTDACPSQVVASTFATFGSAIMAIEATSVGFVGVDLEGCESLSLIIRSLGLEGNFLGSIPVPRQVTPGELRAPLPFESLEGEHFLGFGASLNRLRGSELVELRECRAPIVRIVAPRRHSRPRLIAALEQGAELLWGVTPNCPVTPFADELVEPQVLFHPRGYIVAADRRRCEVYAAKDDALQLHAAAELTDFGEMVAILPAPLGAAFLLCDASGRLRRYEIPRAE